MERAGGLRLRQRRHLARPRPARRAERLRRLRRGDPRGRRAAARRLPRPPGHRPASPAARSCTRPRSCTGGSSAVYHDDSPLFAGIPQGFQVVRYHSLCVARAAAGGARADRLDGRRRRDGRRPTARGRMWGVQFHPESICTEHGPPPARQLPRPHRRRGRRQAHAAHAAGERRRRLEVVAAGSAGARACRSSGSTGCRRRAGLRHLYGEDRDAFWLDSSKVDERARFSFMGDAAAARSARSSTYDVDHRARDGVARRSSEEQPQESIFDYLEPRDAAAALPLGRPAVRLQLRLRRLLRLRAEGRLRGRRRPSTRSMPDAAFVFADRLIAFDHDEKPHLPALPSTEPASAAEAAARWIARDRRCGSPRCAPLDGRVERGGRRGRGAGRVPARAARHQQYLDDIADVQGLPDRGRDLRGLPHQQDRAEVSSPSRCRSTGPCAEINPAPFSAYLRFGEAAVLSSSPERFLSIGRDRWVEAKPIKGTAPRGENRAEDAAPGRGAAHGREEPRREPDDHRPAAQRPRRGLRVGTVHVPHLMEIEIVRDRPPAGLDGPRPAARGRRSRRTASGPASRAAR